MSDQGRRRVRALCQALARPDRELMGASWWYQDLARQGDRLLRSRRLLQLASMGSGASLVAGCAEMTVAQPAERAVDALEVQRREGWNVGQESRPLEVPGAVEVDLDGGDGWRGALDGLASRLAPVQSELRPFYVPTLFQAPGSPAGAGLRDQLRPVSTPAMTAAYARGIGLLALLEAGGAPREVAVVIDLPGPEAVAVAAALSSRFEPVFTFDNWPHPAGVVPSHLTLGAVLYYLPRFERDRPQRPLPAPVAFVLDSQRLAPYSDESWSFDNRYMARLPGAGELGRLGVQHVLYVSGGGRPPQELDDLNDDFVELERSGIDVRMLSLDEFQPPDPGSNDLPAPYYLGGDPTFHLNFWSWYGWGGPRACPPPPPRIAPYCHYRPQPRPTIFRAAHPGAWVRAGHAGPWVRGFAGFGQVGATGHAPHFRSPARSGSFGRWHGSHVS